MHAVQFSLLASCLLPQLALAVTATTMGPAGFTWPTGRPYSAEDDKSSPCGSSDGPNERTNFPMSNGAVAIQLNEEAYNINLAISYNADPSVNAAFESLVDKSSFPVLDVGNECYSVPDPQSSVQSGQNATLQLSYAVSDGTTNSTYYVCADIVYVPLNEFTESISCFNYSEKTGVTSSASGVAPTPAKTSSSSSATLTGTSTATSSPSSGSKSHRLSAGAIAGIVIGIAAVAMLAAGVIVLRAYRRMHRNAEIRRSHQRMWEWKKISDSSKIRDRAMSAGDV